MFNEEMTEKVKTIFNHYGAEQQNNKTIEELAELIQVLAKDSSTEQVTDEIADVLIMLEQLTLFIGEDIITKRIKFKLNRQVERIAAEKVMTDNVSDLPYM